MLGRPAAVQAACDRLRASAIDWSQHECAGALRRLTALLQSRAGSLAEPVPALIEEVTPRTSDPWALLLDLLGSREPSVVQRALDQARQLATHGLILVDEGIAQPILLGAETEVRAAADRLRLDPSGLVFVGPSRSPRRDAYVEDYFQLRHRRGVMRSTAVERLSQPEYFGAMMLRTGDADLMISGLAAHYAESLRMILEIVGTAPGVRRISSHHMVLLPGEIYFLADCAVNIDPDAEGLAEIARLTNVLIFPDLQSGNLAMHLLVHAGEAVVVGPVLMGTRRPVHLLQYGSSADDLVNLAATAAVQGAASGPDRRHDTVARVPAAVSG